MTYNPLVSILIPCYNSAFWLAETIESALAQTYSNVEIIIIDDGSTDNTFEIATQYACSNLNVIRQENQGQCAAENRAMKEAQGDFIQYLDADDLLAPDKVKRQLDFIGKSESEYVASGEWARFYQSPEDAVFKPQALWQDFAPVDWLICAWENNLMMHGAAWLIPRAIADKAGVWDERLSLINDFDYFGRILLASKGVKFCPGAKTYYRSGNINSLSSSVSKKARESQFLSLSLGTSNLLSVEESQRTRSVSATVFQRFIYEAYPDVPELRMRAEDRVKQLGGSRLEPTGGPLFHLAKTMLGWRRAKAFQDRVYKLGYSNAALGWKLFKLKERVMYSFSLN